MLKKTFKDIQLLNGFRVCGNLAHEDMLSMVSESRIRCLKKEHIIKKVSYQDSHISKVKNQSAYFLTKHGKKIAQDWLPDHPKHFTSGRGNERHNSALGAVYAGLSAEEKMSAMNEQDLKDYLTDRHLALLSEGRISEADELREKMQHISLLDMTYHKAGSEELCCVEIVTKNYSVGTINAKEYTATEVVQAAYEQINIY